MRASVPCVIGSPFLSGAEVVSGLGELAPQFAAGVVEGLVEGASSGVETLGENIDRDAVDCKCDEDAPLMWRQVMGNRKPDGGKEL